MIHNRLEQAQKEVKPHRGFGVTVTNRKIAIMVGTKILHYEPGFIYWLFRAPIGLGTMAVILTMLLPLGLAYCIAYPVEWCYYQLTKAEFPGKFS